MKRADHQSAGRDTATGSPAAGPPPDANDPGRENPDPALIARGHLPRHVPAGDVDEAATQTAGGQGHRRPAGDSPLAADREKLRELIREVVLEVAEVMGVHGGAAGQPPPEWYDVPALARAVDRNEFTVREWCRNGRLNARKKRSGRGRSCEWAVSHQELQRYLREGLLPAARRGA